MNWPLQREESIKHFNKCIAEEEIQLKVQNELLDQAIRSGDPDRIRAEKRKQKSILKELELYNERLRFVI